MTDDLPRPRVGFSQRLSLMTAGASLAISLLTVGLLLFVLGKLSGLDRTLSSSEAALERISRQLEAIDTSPPSPPASVEFVPVTVRLLDHAGDPIVGVALNLIPNSATASAGGVFSGATTDEAGAAHWPVMHSGTYTLDPKTRDPR